jgi:hypothetical protein
MSELGQKFYGKYNIYNKSEIRVENLKKAGPK